MASQQGSSSFSTTERRTRRTRVVCISDTHNCTLKLPKGDVLIHAGDLTNQGSYSELSRAVQWLDKADFEAKIVIAGNHDITLDSEFYTQQGATRFHNQEPQDVGRCQSLLTSSPSITYLCHSSATIRLTRPDGPRTTFTVFGSPYSPRCGDWAFAYERFDSLSEAVPPTSSTSSSSPNLPETSDPTATSLWSSIPLSADILVTHTPPHTHCDEGAVAGRRGALGCEALRCAAWRVRPRLLVCGHVHEGRGAETVRWDIAGGGGAAFAEQVVVWRWTDPAAAERGSGSGKRMALVDLTGRKGGRRLDNDGSHPPSSRVPGMSQDSEAAGDMLGRSPDPQGGADPRLGTFGLGGDPDSPRCDGPALRGRMGRRETCVVNCAIAATSWPHAGGKRFHAPIVVDLDLPTWEDTGPTD